MEYLPIRLRGEHILQFLFRHINVRLDYYKSKNKNRIPYTMFLLCVTGRRAVHDSPQKCTCIYLFMTYATILVYIYVLTLVHKHVGWQLAQLKIKLTHITPCVWAVQKTNSYWHVWVYYILFKGKDMYMSSMFSRNKQASRWFEKLKSAEGLLGRVFYIKCTLYMYKWCVWYVINVGIPYTIYMYIII